MPILDAGNVAAKQAGALFDVALGEFLFLAHFAEAVTNNHWGIISLSRLKSCSMVRAMPLDSRPGRRHNTVVEKRIAWFVPCQADASEPEDAYFRRRCL